MWCVVEAVEQLQMLEHLNVCSRDEHQCEDKAMPCRQPQKQAEPEDCVPVPLRASQPCAIMNPLEIIRACFMHVRISEFNGLAGQFRHARYVMRVPERFFD